MAKKQAVMIPEIDECTMRACAVQAASTLQNKDVFEMLGNADIIYEFIDPMTDDDDFTFTLEKQP
jgi:hypothetical protein